jgi:hypothetical protein
MAQQYGFRASNNLSESLDNDACWDNLSINRQDLPLLVGTSASGVVTGDYQAIIGLTSNLESQLSTLSGFVLAQSSGISLKVRNNGDTFTGSIVSDFINNDRPYVTQSGQIIGPSTASYFSPASGGVFSSGGEYKLGPVTAVTMTTSGLNYTGTTQSWTNRAIQSNIVARMQEQPSWTSRNVPLFLGPPTFFDGCVLWLDTEFSDTTLLPVTAGSGITVAEWKGVDGGPVALQPDDGDRPLWEENVLGGKPAIRFVGLDTESGQDYLILGNLGYLVPSAATVIIRTTINDDSDYNIFSTLNNNGNRWNNGTGVGNFGVFTTTRQLSFPSGSVSSGTHTFSIRASQSYGLEVRRGGSRQDYKASGFTYTGGDTWLLGSSANLVDAGGFFKGDIFAMAVFNRVLSDKEVNSVEQYFTQRFN